MIPPKTVEDFGEVGNLSSNPKAQYNQEIHKEYNMWRHSNPDKGYIIADGRDLIYLLEAALMMQKLGLYGKDDPSKKEGLEHAINTCMQPLPYDPEALKKGEVRLREEMLSENQLIRRREYQDLLRSIGEEVSPFLKLPEHQKLRIIFNLGTRRADPLTGKTDSTECIPSE